MIPYQTKGETASQICLHIPAILPDGFWQPVEDLLRDQGYTVITPTIQRGSRDPGIDATVDNIVEQIGQDNPQYHVVVSRGVERAIRTAYRGKTLGLLVISSVGPRGYETVESDTGVPPPRHTAEHMAGIWIGEDGLEHFDPGVMEKTLLHDVTDTATLENTLTHLQSERPLSDDEVARVPRYKIGDFPVRWLIGRNDLVDNLNLSADVARQRFGVEPRFVDWGHIGPLTHPQQTTAEIIDGFEAAGGQR